MARKNSWFYYDRPFAYWDGAELQDYVKTIGSEVIAVRDESAMTRALTYFKEEARRLYFN